LFKEIRFRGHGEAFDGSVGEAWQADVKFAGFAVDLDV
jgi:hypothetical protein